MFKRCNKCGKIKLFTEFSNDGKKSVCRMCIAEYSREWYAANIEREREKRLDYREKNIDSARERGREYSAEHKEQNKLNMRRWRIENLEKDRERTREWKNKNREKVNERDRARRKCNLEKDKIKSANRRAKIKGNGGKITKQEWDELKNKYGNKCLVPGCNCTNLEMDHVIPIALGGIHTIENIQPLCAHHNREKSAKHIDYR